LGCRSAFLIRSKQRFAHTIQRLLPEIDADIVGLNEVTPLFVDMLLRDTWIQQTYCVSDTVTFSRTATQDEACGVLNGAIPPKAFSNTMLVKRKFAHAACMLVRLPTHLGLPQGAVVCVLSQSSSPTHSTQLQPLAICAVHLISNESRAHLRAAQLQFLHTVLQPLQNVVVMGDLNIHSCTEHAFIEQQGWIDLWAQCHPDGKESGVTFDAQENDFIPWYFKLSGLSHSVLAFLNRLVVLTCFTMIQRAWVGLSSISLGTSRSKTGACVWIAS
jgi:endonuclease/exonuclease/phosphatase family metal-dependent hydrolase